MIIADTSGLLALFNLREPAHDAVRRVVEDEVDPLVVSPYVVEEVDYLLATKVNIDAEVEALRQLASGAYSLADIDAVGLEVIAGIVERYRDQEIGVADGSIVLLADRYRTRSILTLDHRHFNVVRPLGGGRFRLLP